MKLRIRKEYRYTALWVGCTLLPQATIMVFVLISLTRARIGAQKTPTVDGFFTDEVVLALAHLVAAILCILMYYWSLKRILLLKLRPIGGEKHGVAGLRFLSFAGFFTGSITSQKVFHGFAATDAYDYLFFSVLLIIWGVVHLWTLDRQRSGA